MPIPRRCFLRRSATAAAFAACVPSALAGWFVPSGAVPIRRLTHRPAGHWFGYYDKLQFSPDGRYALGMEVEIEGRAPTADDVLGVGYVDLERDDRWTEFGRSTAWSWQQGCMLQYVPGTAATVVWNDAEVVGGERQFVARLLDLATGEGRTLPMPVYALTPDGRSAITTDFARIDRMRPGYGYVGGAGGFLDQKAPDEGGVYRMDLATGEAEVVVPYSALRDVPHLGRDVSDKWHYANHLLINPDGTRFLFLNRYRDETLTAAQRADPDANVRFVRGKYTTRMFTAGLDGSDLYELDSGDTSHIIWDGRDRVLAWTRGQDKKDRDGGWPEGREPGFWSLTDRTDRVERVGAGAMTENGHQTFVPDTGNEWILNDTYPGPDRLQTVYLYHAPTGRRVVLGEFHEPPEFRGEWRVDTHPRVSRDGAFVCIDSTHEPDQGRQMYLLDIRAVVRSG